MGEYVRLSTRRLPRRMTGCRILFRGYKSWKNLLLVRLLAANRLELRKHRIDVEIVALFFGWFELRLLLGGLRGRQQRGAAIGGVGRLLPCRALHLGVELDLRAQAQRHPVPRRHS